uniref:VAN3-binding protein-like auxin canalisation domain-containing protein n=1 Tax=Salix viminalis TaxID=40686 RepID=A0A6N2K5W8_SALVM
MFINLNCVLTIFLGFLDNFSTAPLKAALILKSVDLAALIDAPRQPSRSHACSSAKSAVQSACVCPQELMETSNLVPATTIGRPREEVPSALEDPAHDFSPFSTSMLAC